MLPYGFITTRKIELWIPGITRFPLWYVGVIDKIIITRQIQEYFSVTFCRVYCVEYFNV